ncbi:hypothetical protein AAE478_005004 [Parahypoxylon ruwenzoriense]
MTSALRLATLSYAIAYVDAAFSIRTGHDAKNWGPTRQTVGLTEMDPAGWTPKPTAPPGAKPFDIELRRRQQSTSAATCGFPTNDISDPAINCNDGEYCIAMSWLGAAGCCSELNHRDCEIPTTCIESRPSQSFQSSNSMTLTCSERARPHCVTYLYDANFFENLYGISFLACGSEAGSSTIATSPPPGWSPTSGTTTELSSASGGPTNAVTITVFPGDNPSSSSTPAVASGSGSSPTRVGAIVGGVIGGVVGLSLIVAAILLFLRYRKKKREEDQGTGFKGMEASPPYPSQEFPTAGVYPSGPHDPQNHSFFYGELPPQMIQTSSQQVTGYPPQPQPPPATYDPIAVLRDTRPPEIPSTFVPRPVKQPSQDDIVSPITPHPQGDLVSPVDDPTTYTWISNPTPPPQSEYSQFSPPPPPQFQSYRPYSGT